MADISMCYGEDCPLKENCYRYKAIPNEFRQTMFFGSPMKDGKCDQFWDMREKPKGYYSTKDDKNVK